MIARAKQHKRVVLTAVALMGAAMAIGISAQPAPAPAAAVAAPVDPGSGTSAAALVFVSGAVAHPGLYRLSPDARVADAIAAAGGLLPSADPGKMPNMAARVHDGRQINVPFVKGGSTGAAAKLDVNTAAVDELAAVPGMPAGAAEAIVDYRTTWGPFASLSQLKTALGLDTATMQSISPYLRVVH
jgi:competence protein ComEA